MNEKVLRVAYESYSLEGTEVQCIRVYAGSQGLGVHDSSVAVASDSLTQGRLQMIPWSKAKRSMNAKYVHDIILQKV